jgi:carboxyl-terminal processing protease
MSPSTSENFDISMRLKLEGIGAVLRAENEYTVIQRTIAGGPGAPVGPDPGRRPHHRRRPGQDGEMEDVVGWRLQDVVDKIRGPKGSVVRLRSCPRRPAPAAAPARSRWCATRSARGPGGEVLRHRRPENAPSARIGVIEVPAFYRDFRAESEGSRDFTSTTRDVRRLIKDLKRDGIDGLVVDLRGNGGGSLTEATSLTGLFIDEGPVVQVKDALGKVEVEVDPTRASSTPVRWRCWWIATAPRRRRSSPAPSRTTAAASSSASPPSARARCRP